MYPNKFNMGRPTKESQVEKSLVAKITDIKNVTDSTAEMPKKNSSKQTRFFVAVLMKSKERENELSESSLRVSSGEIAKNFSKINEYGRSKSKLNESSENIALNFQNTKTKDTHQET
jgi:hypothetical protein